MIPRNNILLLTEAGTRRQPETGSGMRSRMRPWGITITDIAMEMGVSRQYIWQVLYDKIPVSDEKAVQISASIDVLIARQTSGTSMGERLRRARIAACLTLKEAAARIGYSWVAVERWEKNICLPKPGVLFHLRHIYNVGDDWLPNRTPSSAPTQAV
jgi:transcriptional regulator with XRE-family HTH domain